MAALNMEDELPCIWPYLFLEFLFNIIQRHLNYPVHIVICIIPQAAAKQYILIHIRQFTILGEFLIVCLIIDRVIRLLPVCPIMGILARDDGGGLGAKFKMLVFNNAG